ncbi:hypothetical protein CBS101457_003056 [Exobasidium rhododendri]|nr:hypothetical protein CBS101457_003056 [Exobasidium rhododendri]
MNEREALRQVERIFMNARFGRQQPCSFSAPVDPPIISIDIDHVPSNFPSELVHTVLVQLAQIGPYETLLAASVCQEHSKEMLTHFSRTTDLGSIPWSQLEDFERYVIKTKLEQPLPQLSIDMTLANANAGSASWFEDEATKRMTDVERPLEAIVGCNLKIKSLKIGDFLLRMDLHFRLPYLRHLAGKRDNPTRMKNKHFSGGPAPPLQDAFLSSVERLFCIENGTITQKELVEWTEIYLKGYSPDWTLGKLFERSDDYRVQRQPVVFPRCTVLEIMTQKSSAAKFFKSTTVILGFPALRSLCFIVDWSDNVAAIVKQYLQVIRISDRANVLITVVYYGDNEPPASKLFKIIHDLRKSEE